MIHIKTLSTVESTEMDLYFEGTLTDLKRQIMGNGEYNRLIFIEFKHRNRRTNTFDVMLINAETIVSITIDKYSLDIPAPVQKEEDERKEEATKKDPKEDTEIKEPEKKESRKASTLKEILKEIQKKSKDLEKQATEKPVGGSYKLNLERSLTTYFEKRFKPVIISKTLLKSISEELCRIVLRIAKNSYGLGKEFMAKENDELLQEKIDDLMTIASLFADYVTKRVEEKSPFSERQMILDVIEALDYNRTLN